MVLGDFNYRLWPTNGQNTPKLAITPSVFTIIDPNLGPVGLQITTMALIMILGTSHSTQEVKKIGLG